MYKSKIDLGIAQLPLDLNATSDIQDLYKAMHILHFEISKITGNIVYNPADYQSIPITNTVHSQGIDRMYVKALEPVVVGDFIRITATGIVKALYDNNANGSCVHGVVTEVFAGNYAIVTRHGIVNAYTGLVVGTDYYLSGTVAGGYTTAAPGNKPCQKVGLGVTATSMYVTIY